MYLWQNLEICSKLVIFSTNSWFAMFLQISAITPCQQVRNLARTEDLCWGSRLQDGEMQESNPDTAALGDMSLYSSGISRSSTNPEAKMAATDMPQTYDPADV